jgi:predicted nucleic acid-binding protein
LSPPKTAYLLDSFALLAFLNGETGQSQVEQVLIQAQAGGCRLCMCLINLGEVLYLTERRRGLAKAQQVLGLVDSLPLELLEADRELVLEAAHIKAQHAISYADAFAAAAARREGATIMTGDPEFAAVEALVAVEWLHSPGDSPESGS